MSRASEWRAAAAAKAREEAVELTLPSGAVILARRPDGEQLVMWGRLPLRLAEAAIGGGDDAAGGQLSADEALELVKFCRDLLLYCCVEPRISETPKGEDEIHPRDIPQCDWRFLIRWALRFEEGRAFEKFRRERSGAGAGGDGQDVGTAAVRDGGDIGPGGRIEF